MQTDISDTDLIALSGAMRLTDIGNAMLMGPAGTSIADLERLHDAGLLSRTQNMGPTRDSLPWAYRITPSGRIALREKEPG